MSDDLIEDVTELLKEILPGYVFLPLPNGDGHSIKEYLDDVNALLRLSRVPGVVVYSARTGKRLDPTDERSLREEIRTELRNRAEQQFRLRVA